MKMKHLKNRITELQEELNKYQSKTSENSNRKIRLQDIQCDEEKIKKLFKKPKMKKKENTITMTITILMKQMLKVITVMRMATTAKAKIIKLTPGRKITIK